MIRTPARFAIGLSMAAAVAACSAASNDALPIEGAAVTASAITVSTADANPRSDRKGIGLLPPTTPASDAAASTTFDPRRSLAVTDQVILGSFTFQAVMDQIVATSGDSTLTSSALFHQWWDTQNPKNPAPGFQSGPHCDDAFTKTAVNGFPYDCPRAEGIQANTDPFTTGISGYLPIGLFNRFDLASTNGADCGEYRIVFALRAGQSNATRRNLIIFEALLPNPNPSSGIQGCLPVAQFWRDLSADAVVGSRATKLASFYFTGLPGFEPVVHANHYGAGPTGGGQIRVNEFMQFNWMLREFKTARTCFGTTCELKVNPSTVKVNPFGALFSGTDATSTAFQSELASQVPGLLDSDVNRFDFAPSPQFNSGQSQEQGGENMYATFFDSAPASFRGAIQSKLSAFGSTLTPNQIVARAEALSCAGCHQLSNGADLGAGMHWPSSLGFTHVTEQSPEDTLDGGRFRISPALTTTFLPFRQSVLLAYLRDHEPKPPCVKLLKNCCGDLVCWDVANICPFVCRPPLATE